MAMAVRAESAPLEYPYSDVDNAQDDFDDRDELEAMAAMEAELRERKKGQVIQHRHFSPPLPSSSQPADSPSKHALERRNLRELVDDEILEVVILSPSLSRAESPTDEEVVFDSLGPSEQIQENSVAPLSLGGSKLRRKRINPSDISPPLISTNIDISLGDNCVFGSDAPVCSTLPSKSQPLTFSFTETSAPTSLQNVSGRTMTACTSSGKVITINKIAPWKKFLTTQERINAANAQKDAYYGIDIHGLLNSMEPQPNSSYKQSEPTLSSNPSKYLWTDKYRATKFVDLIGDERIHRDIMRWLKHWDYCVFGKEIPQYNSNQPTYANSKSNKGQFGAAPVVDPYQRPQQRILMLHGPAGLGKTTVAHVAAKLAGYEVLEINASDERSGTAAKDRIVEAIETIGLDRTGRRGKERCIILDECDGGDSNFVKVLVDLLHADEKASAPAPRLSKSSKSKKRFCKPLLRPIICICNDLYATALRLLRPYCYTLYIRPPATSCLIPRLQKICELENIKADARALTLLADSHEGDLRSCLNSLQLFATRCKNLTLPIVQKSLERAKKEGSLSAHSVVERIFAKRTAKDRRRLNVATEIEGHRVVDNVVACGEFDRIISGCHTHFATQSYTETHLEKTCEAYEWLYFYDKMQSAVYQDQLGECLGYIPYSAQAFHELFAQEKNESRRILDRKRDSWEAFEKEKQNREVIDSWMSTLDTGIKQMFNQNIFAEEFISLVLRIISPDLKPVNEQLISPAEKTAMSRVVDAMIRTGLKYIQYKVDDGSFVFKLEPAGIENLTYFGTETKSVRARYAVRQLVSREMEREKIRRRKGDVEEAGESKARKRGIEKVEKEKKPLGDRVRKDFFGRIIVENAADEGKRRRTDSSNALKIEPNVWVRYHEGYSNAVRKPVVFADLIGRV